MAGTFIVGETKIRPGVYQRRYKEGAVTAGARNGIGLGIIRANWGPLNTVVDFTPDTSVSKIFGSGNTEDLITEMFTGGLTSGHFVRIGTGGTAPVITLQDDAGADVLTITGAYVGDRAFTVSIRDNLAGAGRECIFYEGTTEFCKFSFSDEGNQVDNLVAAIKEDSKDFIPTKLSDGSGVMGSCTQTAMTPGTQPTTTTTEYSAGLEALYCTFGNCLCVDTEDVAVHALVQAFIDRIYANGYYAIACLAETKSVALDTRMTHAAAYNDEKIVYVLNSAESSAGVIYDGWRNAARIGGMIASVATNQSLTHSVISGYAGLHETLTPSEIETALQRGCLVLTTNSSGQVWIEQGINTLVTCDGNLDEGWKKIRRVKTRFELQQRVADSLDVLIGNINNDADGRATIIATIKGIISRMVGEKKLIQGDAYEDETNPAQGDSAWFIIEVDDIDSIEKIYLAYRFRYAAE
jgi:hypothetical protein